MLSLAGYLLNWKWKQICSWCCLAALLVQEAKLMHFLLRQNTCAIQYTVLWQSCFLYTIIQYTLGLGLNGSQCTIFLFYILLCKWNVNFSLSKIVYLSIYNAEENLCVECIVADEIQKKNSSEQRAQNLVCLSSVFTLYRLYMSTCFQCIAVTFPRTQKGNFAFPLPPVDR